MRRITGGILKCTRALLGQARWFIARAIDVVVPYQFLSNQLRDCSVKEGQFQCPTCKDAIFARVHDGRVTFKGVIHRIAKYESDTNWKRTYPEMKDAVLYDAHEAGLRPGYSREGTYHKLLRKGASMLRKGRKWIGLTILVVGLGHLAIHHGVPAWKEYKADVMAKNEAYVKDTFMGLIHVDDYYMDYNGDTSDFDGKVPMCNRCKHTVGSWSNPAHGHSLTISGLWLEQPQKYDKYVRACSAR